MKAIEERAKEYSNRYERVKLTRLRAYIDGATEQKKIDDQHILFLADAHEHEKKLLIDKACEWLKNNAYLFVNDNTGSLDVKNLVEQFRKAMKGE